MIVDYVNLSSFLEFGYFIKYDNAKELFDFCSVDRNRYIGVDEQCLVSIGSDLWNKAICDNFESSKDNCVPLSGGFDSRALLAGLIKRTDASSIYTYTYGVPGAWDYEIGHKVAKEFGTKHQQIDLRQYKYSIEELIEISKRVDMQTMLFLHPPMYETCKYQDMNIWSGVGIDALFGLHLTGKRSKSFEAAAFRAYQRDRYVRSTRLTNVSTRDYLPYIDTLPENSQEISFDYIIDLKNRQPKYIWPHVCMKGFTYKTMLSSMDLMAFAMSVDERCHHNQNLYVKMLIRMYPDAFNIPSKSNLGFSLGCPRVIVNTARYCAKILKNLGMKKSSLNYADFDHEIRVNSTLKRIVEDSINDLSNRGVVTWIDMKTMYSDHIRNKLNCADALLTLTSLEIHLKNGKKI